MNKSSLMFIGLGLVILILLFIGLKPEASDQKLVTSANVPQAFAFTLRDGKKIAGPALIQVPVNTKLHIIINADKHDELHVHGYDLREEIVAGQTGTLKFTADRSGRFEIELHGAHAPLTTLQVQPQ